MHRIVVYSHDTFGLGNIRRMLAICEHLLDSMPDASILLITGSPLIQSFRLPARLDYIKLPCLSRADRDTYFTKYLGTELEVTMRLRSGLIMSAMQTFDPHLVIVDKKPYGVKSELEPAILYLKENRPNVRFMLVLRDIIDAPEPTIRNWGAHNYYDIIQKIYDRVLVLGSPEIFDFIAEYRLPDGIARKTQFCGYVGRERGLQGRQELRKSLGIHASEPLVLVTAGGGEDSDRLMHCYMAAAKQLARRVPKLRSVIVHGPEMRAASKTQLCANAAQMPKVDVRSFTDDLMSYLDAADLVVSMGGYNTICEILALRKRCIVVPRARPVEEQWIRAERMQHAGLLRAIHPDSLTVEGLTAAVQCELSRDRHKGELERTVDMGALPRILGIVRDYLWAEGPAQHLVNRALTSVSKNAPAAVLGVR
jgi:predicted glycosyltransferase